jgi:glycosyltransferase involved in cell wall biosynthesis
MPNYQPSLSIIVPTLNEADNLPTLFSRIARAVQKLGITYEIIVVDDYSEDATLAIAMQAARDYPIGTFLKQGKPGKAYSLLEGFNHAKYEVVCMIDADLQYPPEAIGAMYKQLFEQHADVVITERVEHRTGAIRHLSSKVFNLVFTRLLFGIGYDTQSGLKLFKKEILQTMSLAPSPWSFDLEFIVRSLEQNNTIVSYPIIFEQRNAGIAKVHVVATAIELAKASLKLRRSISKRSVRATYKQSLALSRGLMVGLSFLVTILLVGFSSIATASAASLSTLPISADTVVKSVVSQVGRAFPQASNTSSNTTAVTETKEATGTGSTTEPSVATTTAASSDAESVPAASTSTSKTGQVGVAAATALPPPTIHTTSAISTMGASIPAQASLRNESAPNSYYRSTALNKNATFFLKTVATRLAESGVCLIVLGIAIVSVKMKGNRIPKHA